MNNLPTQYFLMHKDIKVCLMDISENGELRHIRRNAAANIDFSIYEKDIEENQIRIPRLKELYMRKIESLKSFQNGNDIWKSHY